jgi:hypothetical protein
LTNQLKNGLIPFKYELFTPTFLNHGYPSNKKLIFTLKHTHHSLTLLVRISLLGKAAEPSGNPHLLNHGFLIHFN